MRNQNPKNPYFSLSTLLEVTKLEPNSGSPSSYDCEENKSLAGGQYPISMATIAFLLFCSAHY